MFSHVSSWVLGAAVSACATLLSALIILAGQPFTLSNPNPNPYPNPNPNPNHNPNQKPNPNPNPNT